jgi:hypothetical protein
MSASDSRCNYSYAGTVYQPAMITCFCSATSTPRSEWIFWLTAHDEQAHSPADTYGRAAKLIVEKMSSTNEFDSARANLDQQPFTSAEQSFFDPAVIVRTYQLECAGLRPGQNCNSDCSLRDDLLDTAISMSNGIAEPCDNVRRSDEQLSCLQLLRQRRQLRDNFWRFYAAKVCPDMPLARWCYASVSTSLCLVPLASDSILAIGSIFGLIMGLFINAPAGARLIFLRIAHEPEPSPKALGIRLYLRRWLTGVRNVLCGFFFGFLFSIMTRESTVAERQGAQAMFAWALLWFPWLEYWGAVFGTVDSTMALYVTWTLAVALTLWLLFALSQLVATLRLDFGIHLSMIARCLPALHIVDSALCGAVCWCHVFCWSRQGCFMKTCWLVIPGTQCGTSSCGLVRWECWPDWSLPCFYHSNCLLDNGGLQSCGCWYQACLASLIFWNQVRDVLFESALHTHVVSLQRWCTQLTLWRQTPPWASLCLLFFSFACRQFRPSSHRLFWISSLRPLAHSSASTSSGSSLTLPAVLPSRRLTL